MLNPGKSYDSRSTRIDTGCGPMYVTIAVDDEFYPVHIFIQAGKAGGCASAHLSSHANKVNLMFQELNYSQREQGYTALIGVGCHQPPCCIEAVFRHVLETEHELFLLREEKEDE